MDLPDPQRLMLDALKDIIYSAHDSGMITDEDMNFLFEEEPESHVFFPSEMDEHDDPDEAVDIIRHVGERDLDAKIRYWSDVVKNIDEKQETE